MDKSILIVIDKFSKASEEYENVTVFDVDDYRPSVISHGDWVVEAINQTLDDPSRTQIICIDSTSSYYSKLLGKDKSDIIPIFSKEPVNIIGDFLQANDVRYTGDAQDHAYLIGAVSMSITTNMVTSDFEDFMTGLGAYTIPFFQSAPNVSSELDDSWASDIPEVVSVGAWNTAFNGEILFSKPTAVDNLDVLANGYIERADWEDGWNFGTSFATPTAAAAYINVVNDALLSFNLEGNSLANQDLLIDAFNYKLFTDEVVKAISQQVTADLKINGVLSPKTYNLLTHTIDNDGLRPLMLPHPTGVDGQKLYDANLQELVEVPDHSSSSESDSARFAYAYIDLGSGYQGDPISAKIEFIGSDGTLTSKFPITWYKKVGNEFVVIETSNSTFIPRQEEVGYEIAFSATANLVNNSSIYYLPDIKIKNINDTPTGMPIIYGSDAQGEKLTTSVFINDKDGLGDFSYQWYADNQIIEGATEPEFSLTQSEVGKKVSVTVSYTDGYGTFESVSSEETSMVSNRNDTPEGEVTIEGTLKVNETISLNTSTLADEDGLGTLSYQWLRGDGYIIFGATKSSYTLTSDDVGYTISAMVTYVDGGGMFESITSNSTEIVTAAASESTAESIGAISAINAGSGSDVVLNFYADRDVVGATVNSFDAVVRFDTTGAEYASAEFGDYLGFANHTEDTVTLNGISVNGISSSKALFTLKFNDLDLAADFSVYVSDVIVNGSSLSGSTLNIGGPDTIDVSTTIVSRSGAKMSDVSVSFNNGNETTSVKTATDGIGTTSIAIGSNLQITGSLDYDPSAKSINSQDALDALRLGVGMDTQNGTNTAFDYIAADFNNDGKVSSQDALAILKYAVGLPTTEQAEWIFVDSNGDYSDISRTNTNYAEGISISELAGATELSLTGILIGDVNDSYSHYIT